MPITQREMDIAELESQLRVQQIFQEWNQGFLGRRVQADQVEPPVDPETGEPVVPELDDGSVLSGRF